MHPVPGETSEDEPVSDHDDSEDKDVFEELLIWYIRLAVVGTIAGEIYRLWHDTETRLIVLSTMIKVLRLLNRTLGGLALQTEKIYYDNVSVLH